MSNIDPVPVTPAPGVGEAPVALTPVGVFDALLRRRLLTSMAVTVVLALLAGPAAVHYFLGDYFDRYLDVREVEAVGRDEAAALRREVEAIKLKVDQHEDALRVLTDGQVLQLRMLYALCGRVGADCR